MDSDITPPLSNPSDEIDIDAKPTRPEPWSLPRRFLFRVAMIYVVLACGPHLLGWIPVALIQHIPGSERVLSKVNRGIVEREVWYHVTPWVGKNVLRLEQGVNPHPSGSGDTLHDYVTLFTIAVVACLLAAIWSLIDRRKIAYRALARLLHLSVRYYVGYYMLLYASFKIIKLQFPFPGPHYLTATYGESSPMRLLWFFMGYSEPYTIFAGLSEAVAGILLLWRRTTTLGALLTVAVMGNVAIMNYSYDVPVKLFSTQLLLMGAVLFALDSRRVANVLVFNRSAPPANLSPLVPSLRFAIVRNAVKLLLIGTLLYSLGDGALEGQQRHRQMIESTPYYGIWEVETFTRDGVEHPPLVTDSERWRYLLVEFPGMVHVRFMDNKLAGFQFTLDEEAGTAAFGPPTGGGMGSVATPPIWTVEEPEPGVLLLAGELTGKNHSVRLKKRDVSDFKIVNRGFRWINEYPYNNG